MHTRFSKKSSPLLFDPEIEKTARQNRVVFRSAVKNQSSSSTVAQRIEEAATEMADQDNQNEPIPNQPNDLIPPALPNQPIPNPPPPQQQFQPGGYFQAANPRPQQNQQNPRNQPRPQQAVIPPNRQQNQQRYDEGSVHTWDSEWDQEDEQEPYDGRYGNYGHDMEYEQQPPQRVNQGNRV